MKRSVGNVKSKKIADGEKNKTRDDKNQANSDLASTEPVGQPNVDSETDLSGSHPNDQENPAPPDMRRERIARQAYAIYESRGRQEGKALDDWLEAEKALCIEDDIWDNP